MQPGTRDFRHDSLGLPKRQRPRFRFTVTLLLWLTGMVAIASSSPHWLNWLPEVPAAAIFVWMLVGLVLGFTSRLH